MKFQINIYKPGKGHKVKVPREPAPTRLPLFIFLGLIALIFLGFAYLYSTKVGGLKRKMRADRKQIVLLRQYLDENQEGQNHGPGLDALLSELQARQILWKSKLVELGRLVPEDIRLTALSLDDVEKTPDRRKPREKDVFTVLTVKGEIPVTVEEESLDHIARLIINLNESQAFMRDFEPLALVYTQRVRTREQEFMEFELSGRLRPTSKEG